MNGVMVPPHNARQPRQRGPAPHAPNQLGEGLIGVATVDIIDPRTSTDNAFSNIIFKRRTAQDNRDRGKAALEGPRQGEARHHLLEDDGKADKIETLPLHTVETKIDKGKGLLVAYRQDILHGTPGVITNLTDIRRKVLEICRVVDKLSKGRLGPDPFRRHTGPHDTQRLIELTDYVLDKIEIHRDRIRYNTHTI